MESVNNPILKCPQCMSGENTSYDGITFNCQRCGKFILHKVKASKGLPRSEGDSIERIEFDLTNHRVRINGVVYQVHELRMLFNTTEAEF